MEESSNDGMRPTLNMEAFLGIFPDFKPMVEQYDSNKVAYGFWDFRVKFPKSSEEEPSGNFSGVYRNVFITVLNIILYI